MQYRKDVQILRGIAVGLVVLFHLGVVGFKSGFLGVDVFFVISGYLMARLYDPAKKLDFFSRRARRILPAYLVVVLLALILAAGVTVPSDYEQVANQSLFAIVFASNIGFWAENSYFDKAAFKPLLHLWSLAVEVQFYLLVPAVHWFMRRVRWSLSLLIAGSAMVCFIVVGISPKTAFFLTPFRLWEFLIGYGIATHVDVKARADSALAWVGFVGLAATVCVPFFPIDGEALGFIRGHPGMAALLIACATGVVLALGLPRGIEENFISTVLEKIGDYSYSIYLTHFPIVVLFLYQPFSGTSTKAANIGQTAALGLVVGAASVLLQWLYDHPVRNASNRTFWRGCVACVALVFCVAELVPLIYSVTIPQNEMLVYRAWNDRAAFRCGKLNRLLHPNALSCEITRPILNPSGQILLVGNSHADAIKTAFSSVAQTRNVSVYFIVENDPLMYEGSITPELVIREAIARNARSIVLHYSQGAIGLATIGRLANLARQNAIRLSLILPVPIWDVHVPTAIIRHMVHGTPLLVQTIGDYRKANNALTLGLSKIAGLDVYETADVLCKSECQLISDDGRPLYFDGNHLTLTGADLLREVFDRLISNSQSLSVATPKRDEFGLSPAFVK